MKTKFIIFAKDYKEHVGGVIVLHKLCHILNEIGYESYLVPFFPSYEINRLGFKYYLKCFFFGELKRIFNIGGKYKVNKKFNTPIFKGDLLTEIDQYIVIYPEVIYGNPLKSDKVVRWFLHQPGFHTKTIYYGFNEIYFKFNTAIDDFYFKNSFLSNNELKIIDYPLEYYNLLDIPLKRNGIAYTIRKGEVKDIPYDLKDAIIIDGLSHKEISKIFKQVSIFISFDSYTAYSIFAVLCGCESIVVPEKNITKEMWYPNIKDRYGLAYGFSDSEREHAHATKHLVQEHIEKEEAKNTNNVENFVNEVTAFFN